MARSAVSFYYVNIFQPAGRAANSITVFAPDTHHIILDFIHSRGCPYFVSNYRRCMHKCGVLHLKIFHGGVFPAHDDYGEFINHRRDIRLHAFFSLIEARLGKRDKPRALRDSL
jgi:hypothetical protein